MNNHRNKHYLLNFIFIGCLLALVVNDHYLKQAHPGWFTGKLSDMAGIVLLPMLLVYLFPRMGTGYAVILSGLLFTWWKSPFSQNFIDLCNSYTSIHISRIIDYTDLLVLFLSPLPYFTIRHIHQLQAIVINRVHPIIILLPTVWALMATSYVRGDPRTISCIDCTFKYMGNQQDFIAAMGKEGIVVDYAAKLNDSLPGTVYKKNREIYRYRINQLIIGKDTLRVVDFIVTTKRNKKTIVSFQSMQFADSIRDYKSAREQIKIYRDSIFTKMKSALEQR